MVTEELGRREAKGEYRSWPEALEAPPAIWGLLSDLMKEPGAREAIPDDLFQFILTNGPTRPGWIS